MGPIDEYIWLLETAPPIGIYEDFKALLVKLHEPGYMHGDVRNTDIIVARDSCPW